MTSIAIIGGGPAGLMAAEVLSAKGYDCTLYEQMPSIGRKFLMAGKSGLNITHAEPIESLLERYGQLDPRLRNAIGQFDNAAIQDWMAGLGIPSFVGSSGRVFPTMMKASPLLRAWLGRLRDHNVTIMPRHRFVGWTADGALLIQSGETTKREAPGAVLFAMGGGSWQRLGSDGQWRTQFEEAGIQTASFCGSNCGLRIIWSDIMKERHGGSPLKNISIRLIDSQRALRGECVITQNGLEGGIVYPLARDIGRQLEAGQTPRIEIDLMPDVSIDHAVAALMKGPKKQSLPNRLKRSLKLSDAKRALLFEVMSPEDRQDPNRIAQLAKAVPLTVTSLAPLDEAISTAGGVCWSALDEHLMVKSRPGTFCAGEMVDWDAPTGGYLLTACLALGKAAADGMEMWLESQTHHR